MADVAAVKAAIIKKTGKSPRSVDRWIERKEGETHHTREVAVLLVAADQRVSLRGLASEAELAMVRAERTGAVPSAPTAAPAATAPNTRPATSRVRSAPAKATSPRKGRNVMVVYGRDTAMKDEMFKFLKALDLKPMEWTTGIEQTGVANPSVGEIVSALFANASAVVVLLTPDDEARLREPFHAPEDPAYETQLTPQARPNVLFEAGMAMTSHPERTVLVQIGYVRPFSDIGGSYITHMNDTIAKRKELATKLKAACAVDMDDDKWRKAGKFTRKG